MERIVIVDDEKIHMKLFAMQLRFEGYKVDLFDTIKPARDLILGSSQPQISLVITDMMMPAEVFSDEDSVHGIITGLLFAEDLRSSGYLGPIFIFTAFTDVSPFNRRIESLTDTYLVSKRRLTPETLAKCVDAFLRYGEHPSQKTLLKRLFSSLILEPNFGGMGIDIRKLLGLSPRE